MPIVDGHTHVAREVAAPALELVERGFAVDPQLHNWLARARDRPRGWSSSSANFLPGGEPPPPGTLLRQTALAKSVRALGRAEVAAGGDRERGIEAARDEFYRGELARVMVAFDLAQLGHNSADYAHLVAVADRRSDPDTSYLGVVDEPGYAFSATPSGGATTTPVVPDLGFVCSPRGAQSWLDPVHPAAVAPRKRPRLTPNPAMVLRNGQLYLASGTPGNDAQPQTMVQVFLNLVEFGMNPREAVEAPRLCSLNFPRSAFPHVYTPGRLELEPGFGPGVGQDLARRGHEVQTWEHDTDTGCGCCAIVVDAERGVLSAGADPRRDSYAIGW